MNFTNDAFDGLIIKAGDILIPVANIAYVDLSDIENLKARIVTIQGDTFEATSIDAIEVAMALKPSSIEGKRLRWPTGAWHYHNIVAHPVMSIMAWLGFKRAAIAYHDRTVPHPKKNPHRK